MRLLHCLAAAAFVAAAAIPARAADNTLLIQLVAGGHYKIWHGEGETRLNDDELLALWGSAISADGKAVETAAGPATAVETPHGVIASVPGARADKSLLIDRDNCGAVKVWHDEGTTTLTDDQLTELMLTALPGGGKPVPIGEQLARAFTAQNGAIVLIWKPMKRRSQQPEVAR